METAKHFLVTGDDSRISNFYTGGFDLAERARRQRAETDKTARILYGTPGQYKQLEGIKIEGYRGKWYVIDAAKCDQLNMTVFLLEHETFGDETEHLITDDDFKLVLEDVWNGFDDLTEEYLLDDGWYKTEESK